MSAFFHYSESDSSSCIFLQKLLSDFPPVKRLPTELKLILSLGGDRRFGGLMAGEGGLGGGLGLGVGGLYSMGGSEG